VGGCALDALLGIDLGTTNVKGVAYTTDGRPLAEASQPTPSTLQGPRRACQDPETLWQAAAGVMRAVRARLPAEASIVGLAIASVGEAGVPLDAQGQALYPIIAWYDERSVPQAAWVAQTLGEAEVYRHTGLPLEHSFTLNKLLWLRQEEPQIYARLRKWLCVADYVAYRLTGEQAMGYSLASRTMALDLRKRQWSEEILRGVGIDAAWFPPLSAEGTLVGRVHAAAARATGLPQGTPVYVGGHDHVCGALAVGAFTSGVVLDSTGTTEAELVTVQDIDAHLRAADPSFCLGCHVARERYYMLGAILGAGSMMSWLANLLWGAEGSVEREQALLALSEAAASSPLGANGLYILPHLAGAGSPQRSSTARGVFAGLNLAHTRADLARAAIEGLAFELRVLWEAIEAFTNTPIRRVIAVGGGARNALWNQIKANVTGRALYVPAHTEATTLGAALLAGLGAGVYRDEEDAQAHMHIPMTEAQPEAEALRAYAALYRQIADHIRPLAAELGRRSGVFD
jgi:xylulokinase